MYIYNYIYIVWIYIHTRYIYIYICVFSFFDADCTGQALPFHNAVSCQSSAGNRRWIGYGSLWCHQTWLAGNQHMNRGLVRCENQRTSRGIFQPRLMTEGVCIILDPLWDYHPKWRWHATSSGVPKMLSSFVQRSELWALDPQNQFHIVNQLSHEEYPGWLVHVGTYWDLY